QTVVQASRIYVIEHGRVAEAGTHDELIGKHGVYYNYYARQTPERMLATAEPKLEEPEPALPRLAGRSF
ncbi:MAG: hypothetical protein JO196_08235, partial [Hyphomicrobiales bacterium]|nr:hypothetical protein [Hyphomicrobiales bacterium]